MESDIIIVNHHLFFADLAIKQQTEYAPDAGILPEVGAVIFDEAHELEDVAGSYFGVSVSNARVEELCRDVEASLQRNHALSASLVGAVKSLRERAMFFFALLPQGEGRFAFENRREFLEENGDEFLALQQSLGRLGSELENLPVEAGRSLQLCPPGAGIAGAAWLPDGVGRTQHRVLDRTAARRPRPDERLSAGHSDRRRSHPENLPLRQAGVRRAHLGDARRGRRI